MISKLTRTPVVVLGVGVTAAVTGCSSDGRIFMSDAHAGTAPALSAGASGAHSNTANSAGSGPASGGTPATAGEAGAHRTAAQAGASGTVGSTGGIRSSGDLGGAAGAQDGGGGTHDYGPEMTAGQGGRAGDAHTDGTAGGMPANGNAGSAGTAQGMGGTQAVEGGTSGESAGGQGGEATIEPECGNSIMETGEQCDEGSATASCDADCTLVACGDGVVNEPSGEQCDDGNTSADGNGCDGACRKSAVCGNNQVESAFEACDDGDQAGGDGCSADCTQAVVALFPVSDRGGGNFDGNGTFDGLNAENSTGEAIAFLPGTPPEERRIAWEFDTSVLKRGYLIQSATFLLFPSSVSGGPQMLALHAYPGNGSVELSDMTETGLIQSVLVSSVAPLAIDVAAFAQTATDQEYPFAGLLFQLSELPSSPFNLGLPTSDNTDPDVRPHFDLVFCSDPDRDGECG